MDHLKVDEHDVKLECSDPDLKVYPDESELIKCENLETIHGLGTLVGDAQALNVGLKTASLIVIKPAIDYSNTDKNIKTCEYDSDDSSPSLSSQTQKDLTPGNLERSVIFHTQDNLKVEGHVVKLDTDPDLKVHPDERELFKCEDLKTISGFGTLTEETQEQNVGLRTSSLIVIKPAIDYCISDESTKPREDDSDANLSMTPDAQMDPVPGNIEKSAITHTQERPYACPTCNKGYISACNLKRHIRTHTGERPFVCDICNKGFQESGTLKRHLITHSGERPHVCPTCNKGFYQSGDLKIHLTTHTGEQPFFCQICGKIFSRSNDFKAHLRTHTGERPYVCPTCDKGFCQATHLQRHLRTHTGEKPFECDTCNKRFSQSFLLQCHLRTHSGDRPYVCPTCNKSFSQSFHLQRHLRTHTGQRPYVCPTCKKGFCQSEHLQRHLRTHTGERPFTCDTCHKTFSQSSTLKKHNKIHLSKFSLQN